MWEWFLKEPLKSIKREEINVSALYSLFARLQVRSILDCSCGLGFKTIALAEAGYEVEGSDASATAIRYAPQLAKEEELNIRFFRSRWEELGEKCERKFDCVFSDAFDWIKTRESLLASAKGIYAVLKEGGKFVFSVPIAGPKNTERRLRRFMDDAWKKQGRFEILPSYEKNGTRLTVIMVYDKLLDGILENRIHLIEERSTVRAEIAFVMDLYKWTWKDYVKVLEEAGFKEVYGVEEKGVGFNVAVK
jgi:SAM-dependent methyltransferase